MAIAAEVGNLPAGVLHLIKHAGKQKDCCKGRDDSLTVDGLWIH